MYLDRLNTIFRSFVDLLEPCKYFRPFITSHNMAYSNLNFGELLHKLENTEIKNETRLYEKLKKRIILANYAVLSNNIYIYIYIYIWSHLEGYIYIYIASPPVNIID